MMRKLFTLLFCMLNVLAGAEEIKLALLQPRVAEGSDPCKAIEINMVRGELRKAFGWQSNFQVLTRTDVDDMLAEHGFQRSGLVDDEQRKQVGIMTGAQYICVSTVTKYETQLYIEAYLVNIETGQMTNPASQYANILNNDFSKLQAPCNELAKEMLGELGGTHSKVTDSGNTGSTAVNDDFVNLGLPSGTLWKKNNEEGLYTFDQAILFFGGQLPTKQQWEELQKLCVWIWIEGGYKVIGPNRESIFIPAIGWRDCAGRMVFVGTKCGGWSSATTDSETAWGLYATSDNIGMIGHFGRCGGLPVRLVR